jgi:hypothetical protein
MAGMFKLIERIVLRATHRLWNSRISALLCRSYSEGVINSRQLHELASQFDPTQKHRVY